MCLEVVPFSYLRSPNIVFRMKIKNVYTNKVSNLVCEILPQFPLLLGHNRDMKMEGKKYVCHCEALLVTKI